MNVRLQIELWVHDPERLRRTSGKMYRLANGTADWEPADLVEAALEALVFSAASPCPADLGLEILSATGLEFE